MYLHRRSVSIMPRRMQTWDKRQKTTTLSSNPVAVCRQKKKKIHTDVVCGFLAKPIPSSSPQTAVQKLDDRISDVYDRYMGSLSYSNVQTALQKLEDRASGVHAGYRNIFQSAFKNLDEHVKDVQNSYRNKHHRGNSQKLYRPTSAVHIPTSDSVPLLASRSDQDTRSYHDILCSSLQVFQIQKWQPMTTNNKPQISTSRCRTASVRSRSTLVVPCPSLQNRADLDPQYKYSPQDFLVPSLQSPKRPNTAGASNKTWNSAQNPRILSREVYDPGTVTRTWTYDDIFRDTTSKHSSVRKNIQQREHIVVDSIDSDCAKSEADEEGDTDDVTDVNYDSFSELERDNDPLVNFNVHILGLNLRPERVDQVETTEVPPNMNYFETKSDNLDIPIYTFKCPLPPHLDKVNLYLRAKEQHSDWRQEGAFLEPTDLVVSGMYDRLVQLEKLQIQTREWEERRNRLTRKRSSSRSNKSREKRCCEVCLPSECVPESSNKIVDVNVCEKCKLPLPTDTITDSRRDPRMRQLCIKMSLNPRLTVPQNYKSDQKLNNTKTMNEASTEGSKSSKSSKPRDKVPILNCNIPNSISKNIDKLGVELLQPNSNVRNSQTRSRYEEIPAKKSSSNHSRSLIDLPNKRHSLGKSKGRAIQNLDMT